MSHSYNIYSIGAGNEEHGPAIPKDIDDIFARRNAIEVARILNANYIRHLPYSSDKTGELAKEWNHDYIGQEEFIENIIKDIKKDLEDFKEIVTHIIMISGHGGNDFLMSDENKERLNKEIGLPVLYVPPLKRVYVNHPKYGWIYPGHADHCEHSLCLYFGFLDHVKFKILEKLLRDDSLEVLRKYPALMGLSGYALPELDLENKFKIIRDKRPEKEPKARKFLKEKKIIADYELGKQFFEKNIEMAVNKIKVFVEENNPCS